MRFGNILFSTLIFLGYFSSFGAWGHDRGRWRPLMNHMCPSEDKESHECYEMSKQNSTCLVMTFAGCDYDEHDRCTKMHFNFEEKPCTIYKCTQFGCCEGWREDQSGQCSVSTSERSIQCQNGGLVSSVNINMCDCPKNFTGNRCQTPICGSGCLNGGQCQLENGVPTCICPSKSYSGDSCEKLTCTPSCLNDGQCMADGVLTRCKCPHGYQGDRCQYVTVADCPVWTGVEDAAKCIKQQKECERDSDCYGKTACCYNGCTGVCVKPESNTCVYLGDKYVAGESFRPESCKVCVCQVTGEVHCTDITCPPKQCPYNHTAVHVEDHCCKVCPGEVGQEIKEPEFTKCSSRFITVNVLKGGSVAVLPNLEFTAVDFEGKPLAVTYSRTNFAHSRSADINKNIHVVTAYSDCDMYGRRAECLFKVIVKDPYPPVFTSCPVEIYALDDETVTWSEPVTSDNVGIFSTTANGDEVYGKVLKPGTYAVSYTVKDFDQNQAICAFLIRVFDTNSLSNMPNELMRRQTEGSNNSVGKYVGVFVGLFVAICLMTYIFLRLRQRNMEDDAEESATRQSEVDAIYSICGPPNAPVVNDLKLPMYSPPTNPPPYTEAGHCGEMWSKNNELDGPPIYEELPTKPIDSPTYENVTGQNNPTYVNDENEMKYMKI